VKHILASMAVLIAFSLVAGAQDTAAVHKADTVTAKADTAAKAKADTAPKAKVDTSHAVHIASPYQDFSQLHAFQLDVGYFAGNTGDAGVGPQGAPVANLSYGMHIGGAMFAFATLGYTPSKRTVLDPLLPKAQQNVGTVNDPLIFGNLGLLLAVTGEKSWHGMVPFVGFTLGAAYSSEKPDAGGYVFGTKFFFGLGAGLRYRLKRPWVLNISAWDYLWQLQYPTTYFTSGPNSVLPINAPDKQFANNGVFTIGLTYVWKEH
jgi:hypothetical protein